MDKTRFLTRFRKNGGTLAAISAFASLVGAVYSALTAGWTSENFVQGGIDGLVVGGLVAVYTILIARDFLGPYFRRLNFISSVGVQSLIYLGLFGLGRLIGQVLTRGLAALDPVSFWNPNIVGGLGLTYGIIILVIFFLQVNRLVGQNVLADFLTGTYHHPKAEERIFLFIDIAGSTALAEKLGDARFHRLLNEFFYDLSDAILETNGEIYKYVGDEVIVTWKKAAGLKQANCLRCFFLIDERIRRREPDYQRAFGQAPGFRAGLHGGRVIAGEVGDLKQEIAFSGDVLNTTARITAHCKETGQRLLVSGEVLGQLQLPPGWLCQELGQFQPRGKQESVRIYSIEMPQAPDFKAD